LNFALLVEKKCMRIGRPTRKPHVATWNEHAAQLRYNIDERLQNRLAYIYVVKVIHYQDVDMKLV